MSYTDRFCKRFVAAGGKLLANAAFPWLMILELLMPLLSKWLENCGLNKTTRFATRRRQRVAAVMHRGRKSWRAKAYAKRSAMEVLPDGTDEEIEACEGAILDTFENSTVDEIDGFLAEQSFLEPPIPA